MEQTITVLGGFRGVYGEPFTNHVTLTVCLRPRAWEVVLCEALEVLMGQRNYFLRVTIGVDPRP